MESERITALLERYWQGETTLEEEKELKLFFTGEDVPEELQKEGAFFNYLNAQHQKTAPDDEEIIAMISKLQPEAPKKEKHVNMWLLNAGKAAAVILIISVAAFFIRQDYESRKEQMDPVLADTFEDPQKAFEETKKALMLVSQQFGKGKKHAQKLKALDDATETVQEL